MKGSCVGNWQGCSLGCIQGVCLVYLLGEFAGCFADSACRGKVSCAVAGPPSGRLRTLLRTLLQLPQHPPCLTASNTHPKLFLHMHHITPCLTSHPPCPPHPPHPCSPAALWPPTAPPARCPYPTTPTTRRTPSSTPTAWQLGPWVGGWGGLCEGVWGPLGAAKGCAGTSLQNLSL